MRRGIDIMLFAAVVAVTVSCSQPSEPGPDASPNVTAERQQADTNPPGDIPDSQVFVTFSEPAGTFTVDVPEGWARTASPGGVTFTDNYNSVRIESRTGSPAPTPEWARSTEFAGIAATTPSVRSVEASTVDRPAGTAVLLTYQQDSAPNSVTGKVTAQAVERYEFFHNGETVALTVAGPVGADNVDPWRHITDSFRWAR